MKFLGRPFRRDTRGGASQVETLTLASIAVGTALAVIVPLWTHVGGRFVETERLPLTLQSASRHHVEEGTSLEHVPWMSGSSSSENEIEDSEVEEGWGTYFWRIGTRLAWGAGIAVPLEIEAVRNIASWLAGEEQLQEYERFRTPVVQAAWTTLKYIGPVLVESALSAAEDPSTIVSRLLDVGGMAREVVMATYSDAVDWKTYLTSRDNDEARVAAGRIASGIVMSRLLGGGGRAQRGLGQRTLRVSTLSLSHRAERNAWTAYLASMRHQGLLRGASMDELASSLASVSDEYVRRQRNVLDGIIVASSGGKIVGAMHLVEARNSVHATLIGAMRERDAFALMREAASRSAHMGHEWRVRIAPTETTRPFLERMGFLPMFSEVPSDYVIAKGPGAALASGLPGRATLGEWSKLEEWNLKRLQTLMPELYGHTDELLPTSEAGDRVFRIALEPRHQRTLLDVDQRVVTLDSRLDPNQRLLALAEEVGEKRFLNLPWDGPNPNGSDATRFPRDAFVNDLTERDVQAKGAGILYALRAHEKLSEVTTYDLPRRHSDPSYGLLHAALSFDEAIARNELAVNWTSQHRDDVLEIMSRYEQLWDEQAERFADQAAERGLKRWQREQAYWKQVAEEQDRAAVDEIERMLREDFSE